MSEFADKVRSLGAPRQRGHSRRIYKRDERTGRVAGFETEHWDDRRDATVTPQPARLGIRLEGD